MRDQGVCGCLALWTSIQDIMRDDQALNRIVKHLFMKPNSFARSQPHCIPDQTIVCLGHCMRELPNLDLEDKE